MSESGINVSQMFAKQIATGSYTQKNTGGDGGDPKNVVNSKKKGDRARHEQLKAKLKKEPHPDGPRQSASRDGTDAEITDRTVYISYIPMMMTHKCLLAHLEKFGSLLRARICAGDPDKTKLNWVFGFAEYSTAEEAKACINDGLVKFGKITIHFSEAKNPISDVLKWDAERQHPQGHVTRKCAFYDPKMIKDSDNMQDVVARLYHWNPHCEALKPGPRDKEFSCPESEIIYQIKKRYSGDTYPERAADGTTLGRTGGEKIGKIGVPLKEDRFGKKRAEATTVADPKSTKLQDAIQSVMSAGAKYSTTGQITHFFVAKGELQKLQTHTEKNKNSWTHLKLVVLTHVIELALKVLYDDDSEISEKCMQLTQVIPCVTVRSEVARLEQLESMEGQLVIKEDLTTETIPPVPELVLEQANANSNKALEHETYLCNALACAGLLTEDVNPLASRCFFTMAQRRASVALEGTNTHIDSSLSEGGFPLVSIKESMWKLLRREDFAKFFFESYDDHLNSVRVQEQSGYPAIAKLPPMHVVTAYGANNSKKF